MSRIFRFFGMFAPCFFNFQEAYCFNVAIQNENTKSSFFSLKNLKFNIEKLLSIIDSSILDIRLNTIFVKISSGFNVANEIDKFSVITNFKNKDISAFEKKNNFLNRYMQRNIYYDFNNFFSIKCTLKNVRYFKNSVSNYNEFTRQRNVFFNVVLLMKNYSNKVNVYSGIEGEYIKKRNHLKNPQNQRNEKFDNLRAYFGVNYNL